jgi:ligand-binding sensor domain-containing protein
MMEKCKRCTWRELALTVLLVTVQAHIPYAQNPFKYSEQYTEAHGLPSDRVTCITQDNDGFWWIGTNKGLARYDGAIFKIYQHEEDNANSIIDDRIRDLHFDGDNIWIGTHVGLSKLNLLSGKIRNYTWTYACEPVFEYPDAMEAVQIIHEDPDGDLWIGTQHCGIAKYVAEKDTFLLFTPDTSELAFPNSGVLRVAHKVRSKNVLALVSDFKNDSILWVGTVTSLIRFNKYTERSQFITRYLDKPDQKHQVYNFGDLYQDTKGLLYTGVFNSRLTTYDPHSRSFGASPVSTGAANTILQAGIRSFKKVSDSTIWITTVLGLVEYDFIHQKYLRSYLNKNDHRSFFGASFIDRDRLILVSTIWGLIVFDPIQQQFELSTFKALNPAYPGFVYAVTHDTLRNRYYACARNSNGLYYMDILSGDWTRVPIPTKFYTTANPSVSDMSMTKSGNYLVSTNEQILIYNPILNSFKRIPVDIPLTVKTFHDIFVDSRDVAWITTREDGVFSWNINNNKLTHYTFPDATQTIATTDSETFEEDSRGRVWMKRRKGYSIYDPGQDQIQHFYPDDMHGSYSGGMAQDNYGNMWIASIHGWLGAVRIDSVEYGIVRKINIEGAAKSNTLEALAIGPQGNLWCVMQKALMKINPKTLVQTKYSYKYGQNPNEMFSFQFMEDGTMVFGKRSAIVIADPQSLKNNQQLPKPYITEVSIGSAPLVSDTVPNRLRSLHLGPLENFFSFRFSTIGMSFGRENSIQYRLTGFQDNWIDAEDQRLASYTNVPGGHYTFELRASNNEGFENPDIFRLPVTIGTPWYATSIARISMALFLMSLVYSAYRYRTSQIRKEERLHTEFQRKLADVQMSALRAQMNPHFIFNCLNSIENFVIKNDTLRASTYLNDFARLIRLILLNSRSRYVPLADEVEALELYLQMESLRFTNKFDYKVLIDDNVDVPGIEIPPMLIQPYVENAIWHGLMHKKTPGRLDISLIQRNGTLQCVIEDNGVGRKKSMEINAARKVKRKKSMGMSITEERIKILNELNNMNTEVKIEDLEDPEGNSLGTRIEINIPV